MEANNEYEDYKKRMVHFPCAFNVIDADKVTTAQLRSMQHNLDSELDINDGGDDERIIKLNILTWVRFRLEKHEEALQLSNDIVDLTKRRNVASLGNRVFVTLETGDEVEAMKCLKDLEKLKSENDFHILYTDAQAEQAYYYSRIGGPSNLHRAIDIFSTLPETPINYARKFGLGLVYRRATRANIFCSSLERLDVEEYEKKAAECLFQVAENADNRLRALAYAQLATLRRNYPYREKLELFHGLDVEELCEKALQHEQNIPSVLAICGNAIKPIDINKAIQWLSKSVEIKENSAAYHHLGICYKRKADQAARKRYHQTRSLESRGHNGMAQVRPESQFLDQSNNVSRRSRDQQHLPTSGSTFSHQENNESMPIKMDDGMADYGSKIASNGDAVVSNAPQHMGDSYGLPYYQAMQSANKWQDAPYQNMHSPNRRQDTPYQNMHSPNRRQDTPYQNMHSPNRWQDTPYQNMHSPNRRQDTPYQNMHSPNRRQDAPYQNMHSPNRWQDAPYQTTYSPNRRQDAPYQNMHSPNRWQHEPYQNMHSPNRWQDAPYQTTYSPNRWQDAPYQTTYSPNRRQDAPYQNMHSPNRWQHEPYQNMHSPNRWQDAPYQTTYSPNRWQDAPYQQVSRNYDFQQRNDQTAQSVNGDRYGSYYPSQVSCTQTQTRNQSLDRGCGQPKYIVNNRHCFYKDVEIDEAHYDNYNVTVGVYGPIDGETLATSAPSVYKQVFENVEETREHLTAECTRDSRNCYWDNKNVSMDTMNREKNMANSTYPTMGAAAEFVNRHPELAILLYIYSMFLPVAGRNSRPESQRPVSGHQNVELRPGIAGVVCSTPLSDGGEENVHGNHQNMLGGRENFRSKAFFHGRVHSTSGSLGSFRNERFNHGSAPRFGSIGWTAQGTGLAHGNTQSVDRCDWNCNRRFERRFSSGRSWKPEVSLKDSVKRCRNILPLSKDEENVQKAQEYFKKAIELSEVNLPAALDLGLLLKQTNQINEALKLFNSITVSNNSVTHRATVISAYEQAGLCYLQLSETETNNDYKEMAKQKLTKAVSIAADLVRVMPELQSSHKKVWVAFKTLLTEIDKEQISDDDRYIQKLKILKLAREYGDVIDIIQKLRQTEHNGLTNPDVIKAALCSYLELGQPDNALGYHNLVAMNPAVRGSSWWDDETMRPLRIKVLLHALLARMQEINDSPTILFQQLFELVFGSCIGVCNLDTDQQTDTSSAVSGDVLFVFEANESHAAENTCPTVKSARCLKRITTFLFGLESEENSKVNIVVVDVSIICPSWTSS
ncbi:hypothetical protein BsWGS_20976 [Bradybaena similaris]